METTIAVNKPTQWLAGMAAIVATLLTFGGPLALAEHYARTGAALNPAGYSVAQVATRSNCPTLEKPRTAVNTERHDAKYAKLKSTA